MMIRNVSVTSTCASAIPRSSSLSANRAETDAATMPRGAIHAIRVRSRQLSLPPNVETSTASGRTTRSEEHTSELQSLMRISYAVFCLKKKKSIGLQLTHTLRKHIKEQEKQIKHSQHINNYITYCKNNT